MSGFNVIAIFMVKWGRGLQDAHQCVESLITLNFSGNNKRAGLASEKLGLLEVVEEARSTIAALQDELTETRG